MTHSAVKTLTQLENHQEFIQRHIGPDTAETEAMLAELGVSTIAELIAQTVPSDIRLPAPLAIGGSRTETDALTYLKQAAAKNKVFKSYIGMGYHPTLTPNVILRNVLENPGWYTAYTPYQPEIAQGRLEALLNFQQLTLDLTGMDLASASLLDEATAAAEAMALAKRVTKNKSDTYFVADDVHPQTLGVVKTRAEMFGFNVIVGKAADAVNHDVFGALLQYPSTTGDIRNDAALITALQANKAIVAVATDPLALLLLKSPGELGADVVLGSAQRLGVPMAFGGPHSAFFGTRDAYKRSMPGRIIGVSKDRRGNAALRMAMQTREQHIRREKANSNICTAQVLLANIASFYAVYHGPQGLKNIAERIHRCADLFAAGLKSHGVTIENQHWFDTLTFKVADRNAVIQRALQAGVNLRTDLPQTLSVSFNEATSAADITELFDIVLGSGHGLNVATLDAELVKQGSASIPADLVRTDAVLTHTVFNQYHSETEMLRYIKRLENKDLALNHSMISLGSCTMKLNATSEMIPIT